MVSADGWRKSRIIKCDLMHLTLSFFPSRRPVHPTPTHHHHQYHAPSPTPDPPRQVSSVQCRVMQNHRILEESGQLDHRHHVNTKEATRNSCWGRYNSFFCGQGLFRISNTYLDHRKHYCISINMNLERVFWQQLGACDESGRTFLFYQPRGTSSSIKTRHFFNPNWPRSWPLELSQFSFAGLLCFPFLVALELLPL